MKKLGNLKKHMLYVIKALNENLKWHYENDLWIEVRKYYCLCLANIDFDINIEEYKKLLKKENFGLCIII